MLGLRDLVFIGIGAVIGSGIFIVPAAVLRSVGGSVTAALSVWVIGGILSILGALTYGELGASRPEAGGLYVYLRENFGKHTAFVYGWSNFFVIVTGSVATLAVAFSGYLREFLAVSPLGADACRAADDRRHRRAQRHRHARERQRAGADHGRKAHGGDRHGHPAAGFDTGGSGGRRRSGCAGRRAWRSAPSASR